MSHGPPSLRRRVVQGTWTLLGLLLSLSAVTAALFLWLGPQATWGLWNLPVMSPPFADVRTITGGAESHALGHDPLYHNPRDPWHRPLNYPRVWHLLFLLGIDQTHTVAIGLGFILLFFVGLFLPARGIDRVTALLLAAAIFSPAVLFGFERGNSDLLIFFILAAALAVRSRSTLISLLLIMTATVLKLFPLFAVSALLGRGRRAFLAAATVLGACLAVYAAATLDDLRQIHATTPRGTYVSYGVSVLGMGLANWFGSTVLGSIVTASGYGVATLLGVAAWRRRQGGRPSGAAEERHLDAFRMSAALYVGTFLLGSSWDYRLMFLIFAVPQLASWALGPAGPRAIAARLTLTALMASCWSLVGDRIARRFLPMGGEIAFVVDELANWLVFAGLVDLFVRSLPEWVVRAAARAPQEASPPRAAGSAPATSTKPDAVSEPANESRCRGPPRLRPCAPSRGAWGAPGAPHVFRLVHGEKGSG